MISLAISFYAILFYLLTVKLDNIIEVLLFNCQNFDKYKFRAR